MSQPNTTPLPVSIQVSIVDAGTAVHRYETQPSGGAVRTGAVWGPAVDDPNAWFGLRHDVDDGQPRRFPTRAAAVAWLEAMAS